jgi:type I restriction enzyme S subunit
MIIDEKCWVNNHAHVLTSKDNLNLEYLCYYLNFADLNSHITGSTRDKLNKCRLNKIKIPLPPLKTQQRIAGILDDAAALRDKTAQLLTEYDLLAQSVFLEMFGDPVINEKGWEELRMDKICTKVTDGTHDTPERLTEGVKFITGKHIRSYIIDYDNSDYVTKGVHNEIYRRCNPELNDVLYTNIGANLGTAALNTVSYEFSMKNVALLKCDDSKLIGRYLEYFLNSKNMKEKILWISSIGGAQKFLSLSQLRKLKTLVPPIELQNEFAEKIALIEQQKALAKQELQQSEDLFNCLLQRAFKGELV